MLFTVNWLGLVCLRLKIGLVLFTYGSAWESGLVFSTYRYCWAFLFRQFRDFWALFYTNVNDYLGISGRHYYGTLLWFIVKHVWTHLKVVGEMLDHYRTSVVIFLDEIFKHSGHCCELLFGHFQALMGIVVSCGVPSNPILDLFWHFLTFLRMKKHPKTGRGAMSRVLTVPGGEGASRQSWSTSLNLSLSSQTLRRCCQWQFADPFWGAYAAHTAL